ncbi:MAG TPA: transporter [Rhodocyclaceae bacterium]|nr:transporter [Rhodocyclaceae bacterium]
MRLKRRGKHAAIFFLAALAGLAQATEGGGSVYPGSENFLVGAAPPPGLHLMGYGTAYAATEFKDNKGNNATPPGFKVNANVAVLRGVWSTPYQVLGGNIVMHTIVPFADVSVSAAGAHQHKTGIGDITVGAVVAHHHSPQLHSLAGLDVVLPTGGYTRTDLANLGRNYVAYEPVFAMSYVDPKGFNGDFKLTINLNQTNNATHYKSGNEAFIDYSVGYGLGNGWTVGVGGLIREQFTDDRQNGATVANNRARSFAIGPSIKYDNGKGWFATAKWETETAARNTTQGNAFWVKAVIPF